MIAIYAFSDDVVDCAGGRLFRIFGDFAAEYGYLYNVHIGPTGTVADPKAFSGVPEARHDLRYWSDIELRCYLPRLDAGALLSVLVRRVDGSREQVIPDSLQVMPAQYASSVFDLRSVLPPHYLLGPRNLDLVVPT